MFPEGVELFLENEASEQSETSYPFTGKTFLYDFEKGDFIYKNGAPVEVDGIAALRVWIEKVIRTEKFHFDIYKAEEGPADEDDEDDGVEYGVTIADLIGSSYPVGFVESELKRELTEAILLNPYIEDLAEWSFWRDGAKLIVKFTVIQSEGEDFEMEVPT